MEPKEKFIKITPKSIEPSASDQEKENKNISKAIESAEPRIPDVTGLNTDIPFADRENGAEEVEDD
jgi:hypothetical protein